MDELICKNWRHLMFLAKRKRRLKIFVLKIKIVIFLHVYVSIVRVRAHQMGLLGRHETTHHCSFYKISHIGCIFSLQMQNFKSKRDIQAGWDNSGVEISIVAACNSRILLQFQSKSNCVADTNSWDCVVSYNASGLLKLNEQIHFFFLPHPLESLVKY